MVGDPVTVNRIKDAVAGLEVKGLPEAELAGRWGGLIGLLRAQVGAFPALPAAEPERSDAAYCLFLHAMAVRTMRFSPAWPAAVATRLGIIPAAGAAVAADAEVAAGPAVVADAEGSRA
jgi:hypothetical protein